MNQADTSISTLTARIKALAGASTADLVGIAAGGAFSTEESGQLGAQSGPIRSVVVLAQRIVDPVQVVRFYSHGAYEDSRIVASFCDALLRDACWRVVETVREAGYRAAIARNLRYGADDPRHRLSYKKAGVLAGLGAFGKSHLLIHPQWGPWLWLKGVVTDAPLPPGAPIDFSPCVDCSRCIEACPSGALWERGFNREACESYRYQAGGPAPATLRISRLGHISCDECMRACPIGTVPPRFGEGIDRP